MSALLNFCGDRIFFEHLRINRACFNFILTTMSDNLDRRIDPNHTGGRKALEKKKILHIGIWYLANSSTYREIAQQFGVTKGAAHRAARWVIAELNDLQSRFIQWPARDELLLEERYFSLISSIRGTIGCIDGCHIKILSPSKNLQSDYIDRTLSHSIILMAVCDSKKKFTYISVGAPGSFHDQRVLRGTDLWSHIDTEDGTHDDIFPSGHYHILGDSAFKLMEKLIVPYKDNGSLTTRHKKFNTELSRARGLIENAFGWLKGRFRRLKFIHAKLSRVPYIIRACAVLHNIALEFPEFEKYLEFVGEPAVVASDPALDCEEGPSARGIKKRHRLAAMF